MDTFSELELAKRLGISARHAAELRRRHDWPHLRLGRVVRYTDAQLIQIMAVHTIGGMRSRSDRAQPHAGALPGQTKRSANYWRNRP